MTKRKKKRERDKEKGPGRKNGTKALFTIRYVVENKTGKLANKIKANMHHANVVSQQNFGLVGLFVCASKKVISTIWSDTRAALQCR